MCCEHLERGPAEVVQELRIAFWSPTGERKGDSSSTNPTPCVETSSGTEENETFAADEQRGQLEHGLGESLGLARL